MSEDDTFRHLSRISYNEMTYIWYSNTMTLNGSWTDKDPIPKDIEKLFNDRGWTYLEWRKHHLRVNGHKWNDPELEYD